MNQSSNPSRVWENAGENLRFSVIAPFQFSVDGREHDCIAFLPLFGGPNGMLVFRLETETKERAAELDDACSLNHYASWINVDSRSFQNEEKEYFIEALSDWGYFGPENQRPGRLVNAREVKG